MSRTLSTWSKRPKMSTKVLIMNVHLVVHSAVSIHCGQLRNIRLVPRAQRVSIFIFTHPECWESVMRSYVSKSVSRGETLSLVSSWRAAVNLLTWITHSSWTTDQSGPSIQVTWPVSTNGRQGLVHDTPLSPGLEIMFSKFSHDIQWSRVFRKMTFIGSEPKWTNYWFK